MDASEYARERDEELIVRVGEDSGVFGEVIRRYEGKLRRYLSRLGVGTKEDQDDLLQDIFLRVYEYHKSFNADLSFSSWIYRIAHNTTMSMHRHRLTTAHGHQVDVSDEDFEAIAGELRSDGGAEEREIRGVVGRALASLTPEYREIIVLRFFEYKEYDEIADILRIPPGTVATRLSRAKEKMRSYIQSQGYEHE